ncbi:hypothetical protein A2159_00400 [Candidatus Woesebacteria bacterium RBG_13_34_9]|uniref:Glycosyltransferase RgtA/B/C/D-like domain-containing protein n=1 Tax=Candidatus Woesebacteria bacterium RBG_13_34_9 TaxID=1802477 RepID=A0A1F7X4Q9_9BACT|nr:MAG: hypothetical protein A2159_00400 [Candidatus Woesebacteria bacterium RBG_13_34_9]
MIKNLIANYQLLITKIINWIKKNRWEAFWLALILLIAAYFRIYKIDEYMTFLGDEGRDVIVVRRLLVNFDPILVGPGTSIGNMYLGPLYYYLIAPFLLLSNFSPVGPAVMVALLGVATVFLVWFITRNWFGKYAGFIASLLYSISPVVITYSKSSWNPNIMPFFSLLIIWSLWKFWYEKKYGWFIVTMISFAFTLQSHYLGLLLAPVLGLFWIITFLKIIKLKLIVNRKSEIKNFRKSTAIGLILFLLLMSPLVFFDARHGWRNFSAIERFFTERQTTVSARPWTAFPKMGSIFEDSLARLVAGKDNLLGKRVSFLYYLSGGVIILFFLKRKLESKQKCAFLLLFTWIFFALVGLGLYKQHIYDHYYGFFFTAPFILFGGISKNLMNKTNIFIRSLWFIGFGLAGLILVISNLKENPIKYPPNMQLQRTIQISKKVIEESKSKEFNFAVIAERNYEGAYQYFFEKWKAPFRVIDPQRLNETITKQLFVICEVPEEKCDPTHNPKAEIANFGWSEIVGRWEEDGLVIYKLVHTK